MVEIRIFMEWNFKANLEHKRQPLVMEATLS